MSKSSHPPDPEDVPYDSDFNSYSSSSDDEPDSLLQRLKNKLSPADRARIAAKKKKERLEMIEFGLEEHIKGYPALTDEEWEYVQKLKRHPELRKSPHGEFQKREQRREARKAIAWKQRYKTEYPGAEELRRLRCDALYVPGYGNHNASRVASVGSRVSSSLLFPGMHMPSNHTGRVPSSPCPPAPPPYTPSNQPYNSSPRPRTNPNPSAQPLVGSNNHPRTKPNPGSAALLAQLSNNRPRTNPNQLGSAGRPNMTAVPATTPSSTNVRQPTALAELGNMNRTFIEGFDAPPPGSGAKKGSSKGKGR